MTKPTFSLGTEDPAKMDSASAAAELAAELGLGLNAGHDLNLQNLPRYRQLPQLLEVSIGHALTVDALVMGMETATAAYADICHNTDRL